MRHGVVSQRLIGRNATESTRVGLIIAVTLTSCHNAIKLLSRELTLYITSVYDDVHQQVWHDAPLPTVGCNSPAIFVM